MSEFPECLQPAVEQLNKYETKISVLENEKQDLTENIHTLNAQKEELNKKIEDETAAHTAVVQNYEREKLTLRELNLVVSDQLREKVEQLNGLSSSQSKLEEENGHFKNLNTQLSEQNTRVSSESLRVNVGQEALSHQTSRLNDEIEELRKQNNALKEENSALTLVNGSMHQRQTEGSANTDSTVLLSQIETLKRELNVYKTGNSDVSFLQSENARLVQRHGEITQEKMQASAKMHTAQKELLESSERLAATLKALEELEFEYQGLQNLHKNLTQERDALIIDNGSLMNAKAELVVKLQHMGQLIQRVTNEKEMIIGELNKEHTKADAMVEEVNHLRIKSRTLAEENRTLKQGLTSAPLADGAHLQVEALEIDLSDDESSIEDYEVEMVTSVTKSGPHFPGEFHNDEIK